MLYVTHFPPLLSPSLSLSGLPALQHNTPEWRSESRRKIERYRERYEGEMKEGEREREMDKVRGWKRILRRGYGVEKVNVYSVFYCFLSVLGLGCPHDLLGL